MKCLCKREMKFISCWDNPDTNHAYNLYICLDFECGMICKNDVWEDRGNRYIDLKGI